jgi:hypothetical protein
LLAQARVLAPQQVVLLPQSAHFTVSSRGVGVPVVQLVHERSGEPLVGVALLAAVNTGKG